MANVQVTYGNFIFSSDIGYPTPKINFGIAKTRTPAGDYLSEQKTVTLNGQIYTKTMRSHDANVPASGDDTVNTLFLKASGLKQRMLDNNYGSFGISCSADGNPLEEPLVTGSNAVLEGINFSPNQNAWGHTIDYEITLKILELLF